MSSPPLLSVVIPVLNEAERLPHLLRQLRAQRGITLDIVVADGGSSDGSAEIAQSEGARLIVSERGRGKQMNRGAAAAQGDYLLFLHADSQLICEDLLGNALSAWRSRQTSDRGRLAGHFRLRFTDTGGQHRAIYRYLEAKSASNRPHTINGDQGLLLTRQFFEQLGGFNESFPLLEDQDLAARIARQGSWMLLPGTLGTSARRFESEGLLRRYLLMGIMMVCYWTGNRGFFHLAREVYPAQSEVRILRLWPFFKIILSQLRQIGFRNSLSRIYRTGAYARENLWQLFFLVDVFVSSVANRCDGGTGPCTRFHDRCVRPLLRNFLGDALAAVMVTVIFAGVLCPLFLLLDIRGDQPADKLPAGS